MSLLHSSSQAATKASSDYRGEGEDSISKWKDIREFETTFNLIQSVSGTHTIDWLMYSLVCFGQTTLWERDKAIVTLPWMKV